MTLISLVQSIQDSGIGEWMRTSVKAMPIVEATHVLAAATVFGTIFIVDLRLLGFPNTRRPFTRVSDELLKLTWSAFFVALVTGALMFASNASAYAHNTAFQCKLGALALIGLNTAVFHGLVQPGLQDAPSGAPWPLRARASGALSIALWIAVTAFGRWIGFTITALP